MDSSQSYNDNSLDNCVNNTIVLSSNYLAPIEYYSHIFRSQRVIVEVNDNFQKQTYRNRCNIMGANGVMQLNIPIEKSLTKKNLMRDVKISSHGNWQHLHWNAIVSAYNSSPFFEYYEDDFRCFYDKTFVFLHDYNEQLRELIFRQLHIEVDVEYTTDYIKVLPDEYLDFRNKIHPKKESNFSTAEYWQVFKEKFGFVSNLSVIDLLFNMGNESRLYL